MVMYIGGVQYLGELLQLSSFTTPFVAGAGAL